jgi:thiol:disulfide interchange protein
LNISYPVLLDPEAIASKKYSVTAVPTTFFIDRNGMARKAVPGPMTKEEFEETVLELL